MLCGRLQELLALLSETEYRTATALAQQLSISEKTARTRLKELNDILNRHGAGVVSKARYGYRLDIAAREIFDAYIQEETNKECLPEKRKERNEYLLAFLIARNDYIKMEELCDFLYVSKTTLSNSLKSVEAILNCYQLAIDRKPNYGIKIVGSEFDIRRLMSDYFIKRNSLSKVDVSHRERELFQLAELVKQLLRSYDICLSEISFADFVEYCFLSSVFPKKNRQNSLFSPRDFPCFGRALD